MLKKELVEKIKDVEDDKDIDEIILSNGFAKPITDVEGFNKLLASNKEIQGLVDGKVTKGIETFKTNTMQKLIEDEVLKRTNKKETPEQKKIRELEERLNQVDKEKEKAQMVAKYKDVLSEKKIPGDFIDFVLGENDDKTNENITLFENCMKSYIDNQVNDRLNGGYKPPKNDDKGLSELENEMAAAMGIN